MSNDDFTTPNDFFGERPGRPSHEDFWKLSEIVLSLDGAMQDAMRTGNADVEDIISQEAGRIGDSYSITYMATQRAMRAHGVETAGQLANKVEDVSRTATVYLEGIIVGARLQESKQGNQG